MTTSGDWTQIFGILVVFEFLLFFWFDCAFWAAFISLFTIFYDFIFDEFHFYYSPYLQAQHFTQQFVRDLLVIKIKFWLKHIL